jgi:hypothetical protein
MIPILPLLVGWLLFGMRAPAQPAQIELRVEQKQGPVWKQVDVHTVFRNKDEIRFLFRTSFPGYLKVVNYSSDSQSTSLFPLPQAGARGEVQANKDYIIPAERGSFVIGGKPGFDRTEWMVSSIPPGPGDWELTGRLPQASTLLPKCSQEGLDHQACLDGRAGPAHIDAALASRELNFSSRDLSAMIAVPDTSRKLVVYEFRVAHH